MKNEMKLESGTSNASTTTEEGLGYILTHFTGQSRLFPRTISTKATENHQVLVKNMEEALARFAQANSLDCRVSAYPSPSELSTFVGVNLDIAPRLVMIDLDRETFSTQRAFEMALTKTLKAIDCSLCGCQPTVIWSGSGYHIYLVLDAFELETEDAFNNNKFRSNPSQRFLRFAEWFLSNGKCDPQHNNTVSLRNCMLRVPGSFNSKNGNVVRIVKRRDGQRPSIRFLLGSFHVWLTNQQLKESKEQRGNFRISSSNNGYNNIPWIENLLQTPIADYRKLDIWHILAPYLLNIKTLPYDESYNIIRQWLEECNQLKRLDFTPSHKIKTLNSSKEFLPVSCEKLKNENQGFYNLLQENL